MRFTVDNITYELITASDIIRDGLGIELWNINEKRMLIEIFRNDSKKKIEFYSEKVDLPFEVIEKLQNVFDLKIGRKF